MARLAGLARPKFIAGFVGVLVVLVLGFAGFRTLDARGGDAHKGKALYKEHCFSCHGPTGKGDGPLAGDLPKKPVDIGEKLDGFFEIESLLISSVIMGGKVDAGMPAFEGTLSKQDAKDILAYVRSVHG